MGLPPALPGARGRLVAMLLANGAVLVAFGAAAVGAPAWVWGGFCESGGGGAGPPEGNVTWTADASAAWVGGAGTQTAVTAVTGPAIVLSRLLGMLAAVVGVGALLAPVERLLPDPFKKGLLACISVICLCWVVIIVLSSQYSADIPSVGDSGAVAAAVAIPLVLMASNCLVLMWDLHNKEFPQAKGGDGPPTPAGAEGADGTTAGGARDDEEAPLLGDTDAAHANTTAGHGGKATDHAPVKNNGWTRLLSLAKPEHRIIAAGCLALLIRLPFSLAVPHFVSECLGAVQDGDMHAAKFNVALLMGAGTVDALLDFWNFFLFGYAQQRLIRRLRTDLFAWLLSQEVGFYDKPGAAAEATSRLQVDTSEMGNDLTWVFRWTIESIGRICGIVIYMFVRDWRLALMSMGIIPFVAVINTAYGRWLRNNAEKVQDAMATSNSVAQEMLASVRTVYSFSNQPHAHLGYAKEIDKWYHLNVKQMFMQSLYYMLVGTFLVNTVVQAVILYYGSYLVLDRHEIDADVLIAFMLYQSQLQGCITNLLSSFTNLIKSTGAGAKVFELLDRRPDPGTRNIFEEQKVAAAAVAATENGGAAGKAQAGAVEEPQDMNTPDITAESGITFKDVTFRYPTRDEIVLRGVTFTLQPGKVSALVGLSGAGKSTLFHLLERFYSPTTGTVRIGGVDIGAFDDVRLHSKIALVGQEPVLFSGTIFSNIMYGVLNERQGLMEAVAADADVKARYLARVQAAARCANAAEFIEKFEDGYFTEVGDRGVQLSGGQKQRVAIARALMQDPQVLLLDEATSALDAASERLVQDALDAASEGRTTLVIAHRLSTVARADKIVVLQHGRVAEEGTHDSLMERGGAYAALVARQLQPTETADSKDT